MTDKGRVGLLVAALKSGLYKKGTQKLHSIRKGSPEEHYWCCLGVAGDVARRFGLVMTTGNLRWRPLDITEQDWSCELMDSNGEFMPSSVQDWYGFSGPNPGLRCGDKIILASAVNDHGIPDPETGGFRMLTLPEIGELFRITFLGDDNAAEQ